MKPVTKQNKKLAIAGAGKLGIVLAQLALKAGYTVYISGSGSPDKIRLSIEVLAPGAFATTLADAAKHSDIIILALPLGKFQSIPKDVLAGKLVVDAMNYWWEVDGDREDLRNPKTSTSQLVQAYFGTSRVVKAFSHMGYHHLLDESKPVGSPDRKAIAIAGNNNADNQIVAQLIDDLGFDPLYIGELSAGKMLEPGHQAFGANVDRATLEKYVSQTA